MIEQHPITLRGRAFSYVDFGGPGRPLVALHGTFGRALQCGPLAQRLAPEYRVIALDQRGHGLSAHGGTFTRADFVADAAAFVTELGLAPALVLGHSLGGVNAIQLAAWHPDLVKALVLEDTAVVTDESELAHPVVDPTGWPVRTSTRAELAEVLVALGMPALGYFLDSALERDGQWHLCFDYADMLAAQQGNVGRWWADWEAVGCPTLLLRGGQSPILSAHHAADMVRRHPGTEFVELPGCGHWLHRDDLAGFALASRRFLNKHS